MRPAAPVLLVAALLAASTPIVGAADGLTLAAAIERALRNYPAIDVSRAQVEAAAAAIQLARTAYLPRVDTIAQFNRATRNNVFGLVLPQAVMPAISGPVLPTTADAVWGSGVGALVTWEPFDFGLRGATVAAAAAARARSEAALRRSEFDVAAAAADLYLTIAAAQQTVAAAQSAADRAQVLVTSVDALVNAELRPGADASRARGEEAAAQTQLIQAQQAVAVARATLARLLDEEPADIVIPPVDRQPPAAAAPAFAAATTPLALEQQATVAATLAELHALERTYFPRVALQGSAYARGAATLGPDVSNYAVGLTVTFPVLDAAAVHAKQAERAAAVRSEEARARQIAADLRGRWNAAVATLDAARRVAAATPAGVTAARAATEQASARYQSGLGTLVEVADAQRLLTSAEIDDALARLNVWRALLAVSVAAGDIRPFVATFTGP